MLLFVLLYSCLGKNSIGSYLPEDSKSTVSLDLMGEEFDGGIPNARVMVKDVSVPDALEYKEKLENCEGVEAVMWLDDAINIYESLEMADSEVVETYYKDNIALHTVTIDEMKNIEAVDAIREVIGDENAMTGDAVNTAVATTNTVSEIQMIVGCSLVIVLLVLILTTNSWIEPIVVLAGLGVAIMINNGTNLIFGEISFVTNAAGPILQLAVSLDYSIFLIHRYEECLKENPDRKEAMVDALCKSTSSIASSGLTTVIGFFALLFMRFGIGSDLGRAMAKGVAISLICVFIFMPVLILETYPIPYEGEETFNLVEKLRRILDEYYPGSAYLAGEGVSSYDLTDYQFYPVGSNCRLCDSFNGSLYGVQTNHDKERSDCKCCTDSDCFASYIRYYSGNCRSAAQKVLQPWSFVTVRSVTGKRSHLIFDYRCLCTAGSSVYF